MSRRPVGGKRKQGAASGDLHASLGQTLYLPIKLNDTIPGKVGVFIPTSFRPTAVVDLIIYFHGHIIAACQTNKTQFLAKGMEYYWTTPLFLCLREELAASRANAILIAPTFAPIFGSSANSSRYGDLDEAGKLDFLIDQTLTRLARSGALPTAAQVGKIILSGHSAGGLPMLKILETENAVKPKIAECWGFECLYFGTSGWTAWLAANPGKSFRHFRQPAEFAAAAKALARFRNFVDVDNGSDHCSIVKEKWREAIDRSGALQAGDEVAIAATR
jgi:hypothetical protein